MDSDNKNIPSFDDIQELGRTNATVAQCLKAMGYGIVSKEQALITMVLEFHKANTYYHDMLTKHLQICPQPYFHKVGENY